MLWISHIAGNFFGEIKKQIKVLFTATETLWKHILIMMNMLSL